MLLPLLLVAGMERIADRQNHFDTVSVEYDPMQRLDRLRPDYRPVQAELREHRVGPSKQLAPPCGVGTRVYLRV